MLRWTDSSTRAPSHHFAVFVSCPLVPIDRFALDDDGRFRLDTLEEGAEDRDEPGWITAET